MKSSILVAATSAVLALANPLEKRVWETKVVVEYYTVTITGNPPAATPTQVKARPHYTKPVQQPPPPPPPVEQPKPTTTTQPVVIVTVTQQPQEQPKPTTKVVQAPIPEPSAIAAPAQPVADGSPAISDSQFKTDAVYHHNVHRSNHSSPEMVWNQTLANWADVTARTCKFKHDMDQGDGHYGQNIALWGVSSGAQELGVSGAIKMAATNMWYDGEFNAFLPSYYGQATPPMDNFEAWGHLSQMVWAASTSVGCSAVYCPKGTSYTNLDAYYSVCNYYPPGNVGGAYAANINRPKGDRIVVA